jgi:hypothetical protein
MEDLRGFWKTGVKYFQGVKELTSRVVHISFRAILGQIACCAFIFFKNCQSRQHFSPCRRLNEFAQFFIKIILFTFNG